MDDFGDESAPLVTPRPDLPTDLSDADDVASPVTGQQFGELLSISPMAAMILDRSCRTRWANDACAAMLGYSSSDLLALGFPHLIHQDTRSDGQLAEIWLRVGAVDALSTNCRLIRSDGSTLWTTVHLSVFPEDRHLALLLIEDRTDQHWANPNDFDAPKGRMCL